ncbi:MAG: recombination protein O N-terminal domain-containing protein, partial [Planctomycetes bacterium]|nr:recombination protein O N-terminal domain-containing protein [Planctomycetota bacterium]
MAVMSFISERAVVLRRVDYSETSQVLVLLTRGHGKVRAIAKGIKRSTRKHFAT